MASMCHQCQHLRSEIGGSYSLTYHMASPKLLFNRHCKPHVGCFFSNQLSQVV